MVCHWQPDSWWWVLSELDPVTFALAENMEHQANIKRVENGETIRFLRGNWPLRDTVDNWRQRHPTAKPSAILNKDYAMSKKQGMCPVVQSALGIEGTVKRLALTASQKKMIKQLVAGGGGKINAKVYAALQDKGLADDHGPTRLGHEIVDFWHEREENKARKEERRDEIYRELGLDPTKARAQVKARAASKRAAKKRNPSIWGYAGDPLDAFCSCHDPAHHRRANPSGRRRLGQQIHRYR
jgi:putative ubiquitin-RnfH superfamily antitoxin RatB of RatAB toxin-antitoxin module